MDYYKLLVALIIGTALLMHGYRQGSKGYVIIACLMLFAIYGLRDTYIIGGDSSSSYLHQFQRMPNYSWQSILSLSENVGYRVLNKLVYELTDGDYQVMITLISVFVTICFGVTIYKYSPNPLASILYHFGLLFYIFHFSALKQSIAMGFVMLSLTPLLERKLFRFFLLVMAGAVFHLPATVFLLAYPVSKLRPGRSLLVVLAVVLIATFILRQPLVNIMSSLYKNEGGSQTTADGGTFLRTKSLIMIGIVVAAVIFRKPKAEDKAYTILLELMGMAIVFQTFCSYGNIYERLADYFFQFSVIFLPMVFDRTADREPLIEWRMMEVIDTAAPFVFCGYAVYRFIDTATHNQYLYPFHFFFE